MSICLISYLASVDTPWLCSIVSFACVIPFTARPSQRAVSLHIDVLLCQERIAAMFFIRTREFTVRHYVQNVNLQNGSLTKNAAGSQNSIDIGGNYVIIAV